jgi:conjugal transfer ATP-binding protein TraC
MEKVLQQVYRMGPTNTGIQVMMYGSPNIEHSLQRQQQMVTSEDDIHHDLLRYRHAYLRKHTSQSLLEGGSYILRDMRAWIAVTVPVEDINTSVSQDKVVHFRDELKGVLESARLKPWSWDPADLIDFLLDVTDHRRMFQGRNEVKASYDEGLFIRDHVRSGGMTDIKPNEFVNWWPDAENLRTRTIAMSAVKYPTDGFYLYQAGGMIGSFFDQVLSYPCPFLITLGSWALNKNTAYKRALFKKERAKKLYEGQMGNMLPEIGQNYADWNNMIQALDAGYVSVRMYHQVLLFAPYDTAPQITSKVRSLWNSLGFTMLPDTFEMGQAFFSSMPMNLTEGMQEDLISHGRAGTKYSNNAIATSPVIAEWKGTGTPSIILGGRRGQIINVDLYDNNPGGKNFAVAGGTGSGKSVFMNEMVRTFLSQGGRVRNFDNGRSFLRINTLLKGQFLEFTENSKLNINPFTNVVELEDEIEALVFILGKMMSPNDQLSDLQLSVLNTSIQKVFMDYGTDMDPTHLWTYLMDKSKHDVAGDFRTRDMAEMLQPWTKTGTQGRWMNGPSNIQFDNDYVLLEMEELNGKAQLRDVVMAQMTLKVSREMFSDREQRKLMLMDEAWDLMQGMSGKFMEDLARRVRKYNGSLGTGTQGIIDYYTKSDASRTALDQSDFVFMLKQKEEVIKQLEKDNKIDASQFDMRSLNSLHMTPAGFNGGKYHGGYAEVHVKSPMGKGIGRLILDPYSLMLYSTQPEDFNDINEKMATGLKVNEAIKAVLADRGVRV